MDFSCEKREKLKNGASMISFCAPHLHTVAFSVVLPFVPEYTPGVYHLVEHLFFERAGERRADEINAEMTSRGSEIDGYTSVSYMCFHFVCRQEVFRPQLRLLHSMLTQREYTEEICRRSCPSSATRSSRAIFMTAVRATSCTICGLIPAIRGPCSAIRAYWKMLPTKRSPPRAKACLQRICACLSPAISRRRTCAKFTIRSGKFRSKSGRFRRHARRSGSLVRSTVWAGEGNCRSS